jgi:hypothetical protein
VPRGRARIPERKVRVTATDARPSSIGEILDRAISTYVRRFVPLFVILALFAIPAGIIGAFSSPGITHLVEAFNQMAALPPADAIGRARVMQEFNRSAPPTGWLAIFYLLELLVYPLARTAMIAFAAETLDGASPTIGGAYRHALQRWLPQVVVVLAFIGIGLVVGVGFGLAGGVLVLAVFAVALLSRIAAIVVGVGLGLLVFAVIVAVVAMGYTAWLMAGVSVAVEDGNPVRAIGRGLRRTLDRPLLKRTFAVALAVVALDWFGSVAIISFAGLIEYFTHLTLLYGIIAACAGILLDGLRSVFVLLYMRDIALRREGSDLLLAAAAPAPAG